VEAGKICSVNDISQTANLTWWPNSCVPKVKIGARNYTETFTKKHLDDLLNNGFSDSSPFASDLRV